MAARTRGFQCHLLTAIVLMFVAGVLIKLNLGTPDTDPIRAYGWPLTAYTHFEASPYQPRDVPDVVANSVMPDPAPVVATRQTMEVTPNASIRNGIISLGQPQSNINEISMTTHFTSAIQIRSALKLEPPRDVILWTALLGDALISIGILLAAALMTEFLLRRKERVRGV